MIGLLDQLLKTLNASVLSKRERRPIWHLATDVSLIEDLGHRRPQVSPECWHIAIELNMETHMERHKRERIWT